MNNARYSTKFNVFIMKPDEPIQLSNMDMLINTRKICGYAVIKVVFGWTSMENPMYKLMQETIILEKYKNNMDPLLKKKILGVIVATGDDLTIAQIADYTKASEEDVLVAVNELVKSNKIQWNEPGDKNLKQNH